MIRSFKNWKAKRDARILAQAYDGYSPSHDKTFIWPSKMSLYDRLVEWEDEHPFFRLALTGVSIIVALVAMWVLPHEGGWGILWQSIKDTFWPW